MYEESLTQDGHTRTFRIREGQPTGWEVVEEHDRRVVQARCYSDWHRVERARRAWQLEVQLLRDAGWSADEPAVEI